MAAVHSPAKKKKKDMDPKIKVGAPESKIAKPTGDTQDVFDSEASESNQKAALIFHLQMVNSSEHLLQQPIRIKGV